MAEAQPEKAPEAKPATDGDGAERAADQTTRLGAALEKIRTRTDLTAKGLAAVGTAAVTAIGYAKFADVFPIDWSDWYWAVGLFVGALVMIAGVGLAVRRFSGASETIITTPDIDETAELNASDEAERKVLAGPYERAARLNAASSLRAYQRRGHRFDRIAERVDDELAKKLQARASQISTEVRAVETQASLYVVRRRAVLALFGWKTLVYVGMFIVGWYALAVSVDALQSERTEEIAVAKSCAEAREKPDIVEGKLPDICGDSPTPALPAPPKSTASTVIDSSVAALAAQRKECLVEATKAEEGRSVCAPLTRALQAALAE